MHLRFSDALRLSWSNISQYKKRSVIIILTTSILFGVVMGFNFVIAGFEKTVIAASAGQTNGDVYVGVTYGWSGNTYADSIYTPEEVSWISLAPTLDEGADQKIREETEQYGGEVVGYYWYYQLDRPYWTIMKPAAEGLIDEKLWASLPENKMPTLMLEGWEPPVFTLYNGDIDTHLRSRLGDTLYSVGNLPHTQAGQPTLEGFNPLNIVLAQLPSVTNDDVFWLIDDGSGRIEEYMEDQLREYLAQEHSWYDPAGSARGTVVVKFSNPYDAVAFDRMNRERASTSTKYYAQDLFGTTLEVGMIFDMQKTVVTALEILLLIVAAIVAVLTFAHLIDQDAATVALYRTMGASTNDIYMVYLLYLIELCVLAIIATVLIALVFVGGLALMSGTALAMRLKEFYNLGYLPQVAFCSFNKIVWIVFVMELAIAPISLFFTLRRFSPKHVAKKLKED